MKDTLTGQLGVVILVEQGIHEIAARLSEEFPNNKITFQGQGGACISHVTLYHSFLYDVQVSCVERFLNHIASSLPITPVLNHIVVSGGRFVFWCLEKTENLLTIHESALEEMSKYHRPERQHEDVKGENLILTPDETANIKRYGHPLVGRQHWVPHITLAYLKDKPNVITTHHCVVTNLTSVAFVRVGKYGTVHAKQILLRSS